MDGYPTPAHEVTTRLCYAGVFGDGLTSEALIRRSRHRADEITAALATLVREGRLEEGGGRYSLPGVAATPTAGKREQRALALEILRDNRRLIRVVCSIPFVRVLAVSGSVAQSTPRSKSSRPPDLDFFVITSEHTLHVVRVFVLVLLWLDRFLPTRLSSRRFPPCFNFFLDAARLEIHNQSFYTATEAWGTRVLKGRGAYRRFLYRNAWIARYYANGYKPEPAGVPTRGLSLGWSWSLAAANVGVFLLCWAASWAKRKLLRRPQGYSWRDDPSREVTLRRAWPEGGGYQVTIFARFRELYARHFQDFTTPSYLDFLFPGTSASGIWVAGAFLPAPLKKELGQLD